MTMAPGLDVSTFQTTTPPLAGFSFMFARATYDLAADTRYAMHAADAKASGTILGAYHFGTGRSTPQAQASAFLNTAGDAKLLALDLESDAVPMTIDQAAQFIQAVHAAGRKCGLYHSLSGFPSLGQDWNWVASWGANTGSAGAPPTIPWAFWQYTSAGHVAGYPDNLDLDYFNGTTAELITLAGGSMKLPYLPTVAIGTATVAVPYVQTFDADGVTTNQPVGTKLDIFGQGTLLVPVNSANATNLAVYVTAVGGKAAYVLQNNVTYTPNADPTPFSKADLDSATSADRAKAHIVISYD